MGGSCPVGDRPLFSVLHRAGPWKFPLTGHSQRRCKATCLLPHSPPQRAKAGIPQIPGRLRGRGNGYASTHSTCYPLLGDSRKVSLCES